MGDPDEAAASDEKEKPTAPAPPGWRVVGTTGEGRLIAYGCECHEDTFPSEEPRQTKPKRGSGA